MTVSPAFGRLILFVCLLLSLSACSQFGEAPVDEEREAHFLAGKSKKNSHDYKGAIESFEKALEVNPKSAAAHLELGLLYEEKMNDHAAAIYHFRKHLQLRPNSNVGDMVRGQINNCVLELAKTVPFSLINSKVQAGIDKLNSENQALRQQVEELKGELARVSALTNRPAIAAAPSAHPTPAVSEERPVLRPEPPAVVTPRREPEDRSVAPTLRPHRVRRGETVASIARQYGVALNDVLAANPGLVPKRMREGQTIQVPVRSR